MAYPVLEAENLTKSFSAAGNNRTEVLKGVSCSIGRGEFVAIVGASGVGKSTLLHVLGALEAPDSGQVRLYVQDDRYIEYEDADDEVLSQIRNTCIGFVFQFHHLLPEFTTLENVMMPALIAGLSRHDAEAKARDLLVKVSMSHRLQQKPTTLSGGEQQRVAFARALVNSPAIVLADEPTGNLDAANSGQLLELMKRFQEEHRQTFVVVTHSTDIAGQADRVLTMKDGRFVKLPTE